MKLKRILCVVLALAAFFSLSVGLSAQTDVYVAESAVVHIETALEYDTYFVYVKLVALVDMVVYSRAEKIVRSRDSVHIAREVKVYVLHGHYL